MTDANRPANPQSTDPCEKCGAPVHNYVEQRCCSGHECGCMGMPLSPCWCDACWSAHTAQAEENTNKLAGDFSI